MKQLNSYFNLKILYGLNKVDGKIRGIQIFEKYAGVGKYVEYPQI